MDTHTRAWGGLQFKLLSCHQALIDGSSSHGCYMISCYWPCNFSVATFGWVSKMIWSNTEVQFHICIDYIAAYTYNDVSFSVHPCF